MFIRSVVLALFVVLTSFSVCASDNSAQAGSRTITIAPSVAGASLFPLKNPGVVTLGTLAINSRVDFAINAVSTNGNLSYLWVWGDGTPPGTGPFPNHTYVTPGNYSVTVTVTESGNPAGNAAPVTKTVGANVTDAIKNNKLLTNENWSRTGGDSLQLTGVAHMPIFLPIAGQSAFFDVGGVQLSFVLNDKGVGTLTTNANVIVDPVLGTSTTTITPCKASVKFVIRKHSSFDTFFDSFFTLKVKNASFSPALADETITNRNSKRDAVRITAKLTIFGILFQSGINQSYNSTQGKRGVTR